MLLLVGYWLAAELFPEMVDGYALTWLPPAPWLFLFGALVGAAFGFPVALAAGVAVFIQSGPWTRLQTGTGPTLPPDPPR